MRLMLIRQISGLFGLVWVDSTWYGPKSDHLVLGFLGQGLSLLGMGMLGETDLLVTTIGSREKLAVY